MGSNFNFETDDFIWQLLQALGIIRNEATRNPAIVRAYLEEIIEECWYRNIFISNLIYFIHIYIYIT
jgi:hypothetical protein